MRKPKQEQEAAYPDGDGLGHNSIAVHWPPNLVPDSDISNAHQVKPYVEQLRDCSNQRCIATEGVAEKYRPGAMQGAPEPEDKRRAQSKIGCVENIQIHV